MAVIYSNNDVRIEIERANADEFKVNINGGNLIWISRDSREEFEREFIELLDKHRI